MATKKATEEMQEFIPVIPEEERKVKIRIPITREEKEPVPVWVNDRSWLIQRGVDVEVPECVYEVLCHRDEMMEVCFAYENKNAKHD